MRNQAAQRCKTPRRRVGARRYAVIGQAIPARQRQHRNIRRRKSKHLLDIGDALAIGKDIGDRAVGTGKFGKDQRFDPGWNRADGQLAGGAGNFLGVKTGNHQAFLSLSASSTSKSGR